MSQRSHEDSGLEPDPAPGDFGADSALSGADAAALEAELARVRAESEERLASWQRAQADYQNLRRRLSSDVDAEVQRAKKGLVTELLLVLDYLEMALSAPCTSADAKGLQSGVEMTRGALLSALEREGLALIPEGGRFDSAIHQAVERVETLDFPPSTVIATLRRGYTHNGNVLRPAQVKVAVPPANLASNRGRSAERGDERA